MCGCAGKPLDMRKLWQEVQQQGGFEAVTAAKRWTRVGKALAINQSVVTNLPYLLK